MLHLTKHYDSHGPNNLPAYVKDNSNYPQLYGILPFGQDSVALYLLNSLGEPICRLEEEYKIKKEPKCQNKS